MDNNSAAEQLLLLNAYQKLNADLHMNGTAAANSVINGNSNNNSSNNNGGVVEDFCELCNKQFCNKYYLKVRYTRLNHF